MISSFLAKVYKRPGLRTLIEQNQPNRTSVHAHLTNTHQRARHRRHLLPVLTASDEGEKTSAGANVSARNDLSRIPVRLTKPASKPQWRENPSAPTGARLALTITTCSTALQSATRQTQHSPQQINHLFRIGASVLDTGEPKPQFGKSLGKTRAGGYGNVGISIQTSHRHVYNEITEHQATTQRHWGHARFTTRTARRHNTTSRNSAPTPR